MTETPTFPQATPDEHRLMNVDRREYVWPEMGNATNLLSRFVPAHTVTERRWVCSCGQRGRWAEEASMWSAEKHRRHARAISDRREQADYDAERFSWREGY